MRRCSLLRCVVEGGLGEGSVGWSRWRECCPNAFATWGLREGMRGGGLQIDCAPPTAACNIKRLAFVMHKSESFDRLLFWLLFAADPERAQARD